MLASPTRPKEYWYQYSAGQYAHLTIKAPVQEQATCCWSKATQATRQCCSFSFIAEIATVQGRNVLLAEDNLINQTVAKKMLCSLGMVVEVAANGLDAVDAVRRRQQRKTKPFDVILMDMAMPVMGGVEATKVGTAADQKPTCKPSRLADASFVRA